MALVELQNSNALNLLFSTAPTSLGSSDSALMPNAGPLQQTVPAAPSFAALLAQAQIPVSGTLTTVIQPVEITTVTPVEEQDVSALNSNSVDGDPDAIDQNHIAMASLLQANLPAADLRANTAADASSRFSTAASYDADIAQLEQLLQMSAESPLTADSLQTLTVLVTPPEQISTPPDSRSETEAAAETTADNPHGQQQQQAADVPQTASVESSSATASVSVSHQSTVVPTATLTADPETTPTTGSATQNISAATTFGPAGVATIDAGSVPSAAAQQLPGIRLFDPAAETAVSGVTNADDVPAHDGTTVDNAILPPTTVPNNGPSAANSTETIQPALTQQPPIMAGVPPNSNGSHGQFEFGTTTTQAVAASGATNNGPSKNVTSSAFPLPDTAGTVSNTETPASIAATLPQAPENGVAPIRIAPETTIQHDSPDTSQSPTNSSSSDVDAKTDPSEALTRLSNLSNRSVPHQTNAESKSTQQFTVNPGTTANVAQGIPRNAGGMPSGSDVVVTEPTATTATPNKGGVASDNLSLGAIGNGVPSNTNLLQPSASTPTVNVLDQLSTEVMQRAESLGQDAEQRFTIRLDPPELGKLVISMKRTVHGIEMHVDAADPVTLNLIQSGLEQLDSDANDAQSVFRQLNIDVTTGDGSGRSAHDRRPAFAATPSSPLKMEDEAAEQALPDRISFVA